MQRVFITGLTGFVGTYLEAELIRCGYQVSGTTRQSYSPKKIHIIPTDIRRASDVLAAFKKNKPDAIIHLAAKTNPSQAWRNISEVMNVNARGTLHVLEAVRRTNPKMRVLFASSSHVYGRTLSCKQGVEEKDLCWPQDPYGTGKYLAELMCLDYHHRFGLDVIIARPFNHAGPGQDESFVLSSWARQVALMEKGKRDRSLSVGNIDVSRDFVDVEDVVCGYEKLLRDGHAGETYNISSDHSVYLRELLEIYQKEAKVEFRIVQEPALMRANETRLVSGNSTKLRELGWRPSRPIQDTIKRMIAFWRSAEI